jgi:hypothetical protein
MESCLYLYTSLAGANAEDIRGDAFMVSRAGMMMAGIPAGWLDEKSRFLRFAAE